MMRFGSRFTIITVSLLGLAGMAVYAGYRISEREISPDLPRGNIPKLPATPESTVLDPSKKESSPTPETTVASFGQGQPAGKVETSSEPFIVFGTATVAPRMFLDGAGKNIDSPEFFIADPPDQSLLFVSGKSNDLVEQWKFPFRDNEAPSLKRSSLPNGLAIDRDQKLLLIGDSEKRLVAIYALPSLRFIKNIGEKRLENGETNLDILTRPDGQKVAYITESHRIKSFDVETGISGPSFTPDVESIEEILADDYYQILYIPEENGGSSKQHPGGALLAYAPDGTPLRRHGTNRLGQGVFSGDGEGITLYPCLTEEKRDTGRGFIIAVDQSGEGKNGLEFFDRETWQHLGTVVLAGVSGTDGVDASAFPLPGYPAGILAATHHDSSTVIVDFDDILSVTHLRCVSNDSAL